MAFPGSETLLSSVVDALHAVSESTEAVYLRMGDAFPRLVRELDASVGTAAGHDHPLFVTIDATQEAITEHDAAFRGAQGDGKAMLAKLDQQLSSLATLGTGIEAIREDSVLMELISLNAMVIAVKAGEAGRAFSCITGELKQLSNQTMALTDQIAHGEGALDRVFREFMSDLRKLSATEQSELESFLGRVKEIFDGLHAGASALWDGLEAIRLKTDEVKVPLVRIVVDIQNQDRIRQSIDHVILSLREFRALDPSATREEQLDELSFLELLPELSSQVLDEIGGQIAENRRAFQRSLDEAGRLVEALEGERAAFIDEHLASRRTGSLESWFEHGENALERFVSQTESAGRSREFGFRRSAVLQKNVSDLVELLRSFDFLLSKFRNIDLASRIQVARQAALSSMRDNASEMSTLTRKIETDVAQSIGITSGFFATVEALFTAYRTQFATRVQQDREFNQRLRTSMTELKSARDFLRHQVQSSRVFTTTFTELFARTQKDLSTLDHLLAQIEEQKANLAALRSQIAEQKRRTMAEHGVTSWKLESEKLKAMVDRFTIFTHKQMAAELGDFEVEASVASGDVTLF